MKKGLKIVFRLLAIAIALFVLVSIFLLADLRTSEIKNDSQSEKDILFAKTLLNDAIAKQGLDSIHKFSTYEIIGSDHWNGVMGKMANPWDWNKDEMSMRFGVGDFDGQVEVLEGDKAGFIAGIQSWDYYEKVGDDFQTDVEDDNGKIFTTAAIHYFLELGNRLSNAPYVRYAGQEQLKGKTMEKVFVSWGNDCTKEYDHYLIWIGKESGLVEATAFTTRDNPKPAPAFMYGSLQFDDYRNINGILIPFKQTAQIGTPKDDLNEYVHQIIIKKFEWDSFDISSIRPFSGIDPVGDDKPHE